MLTPKQDSAIVLLIMMNIQLTFTGAALILAFGYITLPVMIITFPIWYIIYVLTR